jgi:TonB family protein
MSSAVFKTDLLMFGDLLALLRQHGFRIGVDHYLRLQQLLDKVGDHCAPGELRTLLCPIFATSKTQQEQFYKVFDSYFELFRVIAESTEADESFVENAQTQMLAFKPKSSRRKWLYAAMPVALAALIFILVLFLKPKAIEQSASTQAKTEATATASPDVSPESVNVSPATVTTSRPQVVKVSEAPLQSSEAQPSTPIPTPTSTPEQSFYQRYRIGIHIAIILSPLILFLLYEWYRFTRRKLLLQKQQARKPPLIWPIRVDAPAAGLYDSEQFLTAARLLRRRQTDEHRRLDVEATVAATVEHQGFPDFRYKSDSRVPEYLVLIDRASYRDHQARLFDEMTQALERESVFVSRYFYDGDPRVCRDESGAGVVQLTELQNRYSNHRLLIFGNGEKLLDQITGRLDGWTAIFDHWQDRALLTVETPARWGLREISLAQLFIVLPATLNGLLALVDHFETTVPADLRSWVRGDFETPVFERTPAETVAALRRSLGEDAFQWLAACAVYTELQWNLTLLIGSLPSMPPGLVTESNLLKLIRLPWFRTGLIPDEVRWLLINELAPERQKAVRAALIELLEKDPAPPETFASDHYRLNLFAQRWLQSRTRKRLRELTELVKQLPRSQIVRDLTLIRFLESAQRTPLDFLLPDRLRNLFYHRGVPAFGLKTGARFLFTLFLVGVVWIGIRAFSPKVTASNPAPDLVTQNIKRSPDPTPVNSEPLSAPDSAPQPEITPDNGNTSPIANSSPLPKQTMNAAPTPSPKSDQQQTAAPTNSNDNQQPGTLASSPIERSVTSLPPAASEQTSSNPQQSEKTKGVERNQTPAQNKEPPPPQPTPTPAPTPNAPVSLGVLNSMAISLPKPKYPQEAVAARVAGQVVVLVTVDESGKVISANARKGPDLLRKAAEDAAYKARFKPLVMSGVPVKVTGAINYDFVLKQPPLELPPNEPRPGSPGQQPSRRRP